MQYTIEQPITLKGVGLHSGCRVSVTLRPAPPDTGVVFRRVDLQGFRIEAHRRWVARAVLATNLMKRGVLISTVEHLLSALAGCGVDNVWVDIDSLELPILDGSALPWVEAVRSAGLQRQSAERSYYVIQREIRVEDGDRWITLEPAPEFSVEYTIEFSHSLIGRQSLELAVTPGSYREEIAFARTFGFYAEVEDLRRKGLIRGGSLENAIVLTPEGLLGGALRAPDEFVRHKVLDLIGDVSLAGAPVVGRIRAYRAGHALHTRVAAVIAGGTAGVVKVRESRLAAGTALAASA
ncbi:MAG TPA: UDP-3-O-acyl-N-acetylglucosamine deacetylase [Acidobacteriota bacterium]|nr:UDP-3-O-acyl-N-acetylglucosamine deacetylase [Acidobacteriota bacterium]